MPKIPLNPQSVGRAVDRQDGDMRHPQARSARDALVSRHPDVQALFERLGLAHVEGLPVARDGVPTEE